MQSVLAAKDFEPGFRVFAHLKIGEIKILNERKTFDGQTTRVAEVLVGDESGSIIFFAKEESLNKIKEGEVYTFFNAHAAVVKEHMRLEVDKWAQLQKASGVKIAKINIDDNPDVPVKYGIRSIPTLMMFKNGEVASTKIGAASKSALSDWIQSDA